MCEGLQGSGVIRAVTSWKHVVHVCWVRSKNRTVIIYSRYKLSKKTAPWPFPDLSNRITCRPWMLFTPCTLHMTFHDTEQEKWNGEMYDLREEKAVELAVFLGQDWTQNLFLASSSTQKSNKSIHGTIMLQHSSNYPSTQTTCSWMRPVRVFCPVVPNPILRCPALPSCPAPSCPIIPTPIPCTSFTLGETKKILTQSEMQPAGCWFVSYRCFT